MKSAFVTKRVGNLRAMMQIGSMPDDLTVKNVTLFAQEVRPRIRHLWQDAGLGAQVMAQGCARRNRFRRPIPRSQTANRRRRTRENRSNDR